MYADTLLSLPQIFKNSVLRTLSYFTCKLWLWFGLRCLSMCILFVIVNCCVGFWDWVFQGKIIFKERCFGFR